jgi:cytoskeletal protein CcmA (bactofilin family)
VEGQISGNNIVISGKFDGVIEARGKVELQAKAIVTGEIHTPCLLIEPGALFDGTCRMLTSSDANKSVTIPIRSVATQS